MKSKKLFYRHWRIDVPLRDYCCKNCQFVIEDKLVFAEDEAETITCPNCGSTAHKLPSFANFVIKGYNAKNGYSKTEANNGK